MERQQGRGLGAVVEVVRLGHQGDLLQEVAQVQPFVDAGHGAQFHDVFPAVNALVCAVVEIFAVLDLGQDGVKQLADGRSLAQGVPCGQLAAELVECVVGAPVERVLRVHVGRQPHQRLGGLQTLRRRPEVELLLRRLADAARGHVEDAAEADRVQRIVDDAQVSDDVLDLAPLIELRRPDQPVGQARLDERLFQGARLGVGAVHHGAGIAVVPLEHQVLDGVDDRRRLILLVIGFAHDDLRAPFAFGKQLLGLVVGVAPDNAHGRVEDGLGGAVVLLQQDGPRCGEVAVEVLDVAIIRAAPLIDRLVGIADGKDAVRIPGQLPQEAILRGVGVLELIDEDMLVAALILGQHVRPLVEQQHHLHQQIVEVHGVVGLERRLVVLIDAPRDLADVVGRPVEIGGDQIVLGAADAVEHLGRWKLLVVEPEFGQRALDDLKLVGRVEDDEVALVMGQVIHFAAQQAGADGMERAHVKALGTAAEQLLDAMLHLARCLVGEGHGHDVPRRDAHVLDEVGDAVGQNARLATAGPGDDEQRPRAGADGVALGRVQVLQQIHEVNSITCATPPPPA